MKLMIEPEKRVALTLPNQTKNLFKFLLQW